jgi:hypothetical protein
MRFRFVTKEGSVRAAKKVDLAMAQIDQQVTDTIRDPACPAATKRAVRALRWPAEQAVALPFLAQLKTVYANKK